MGICYMQLKLNAKLSINQHMQCFIMTAKFQLMLPDMKVLAHTGKVGHMLLRKNSQQL